MRLKVRPFERTVEPSFPENDALPKKDEDTRKFDTTFSEWWEEVRINLGRLDDQLQKYVKTDLSETIVTQKLDIENNITQEVSNVTNITQTNNDALIAEISLLKEEFNSLSTLLNSTRASLASTSGALNSTRASLASTSEALNSTRASLASTSEALNTTKVSLSTLRGNLYSI